MVVAFKNVIRNFIKKMSNESFFFLHYQPRIEYRCLFTFSFRVQLKRASCEYKPTSTSVQRCHTQCLCWAAKSDRDEAMTHVNMAAFVRMSSYTKRSFTIACVSDADRVIVSMFVAFYTHISTRIRCKCFQFICLYSISVSCVSIACGCYAWWIWALNKKQRLFLYEALIKLKFLFFFINYSLLF